MVWLKFLYPDATFKEMLKLNPLKQTKLMFERISISMQLQIAPFYTGFCRVGHGFH